MNWLPSEIVLHGGNHIVVERLVRAGDPAFLDGRSIRASTTRRLSVLRNDDPSADPAGMIFHMSRCGSTLAARVVAAAGGAMVLNEPPGFRPLLTPGDPAVTTRVRQLLARYEAATGGGRMIVKWASGLNCFLPQLLAMFPGTRTLFVVRNPLEVLESACRQPNRMLASVSALSLAPHLRVDDPSQLDVEERAARYIASHCYWAAQADALFLLPYETLAAFPERVVAFFGGTPDSEAYTRIRAELELYSKDRQRQRRFYPDGEDKRSRASARVRDLTDQYITPEYHALIAKHPTMPHHAA